MIVHFCEVRYLSMWAGFVFVFFFFVIFVAARIREILENAGLAQESLQANVVASAQVLANVANLLNVRDTELSRLEK